MFLLGFLLGKYIALRQNGIYLSILDFLASELEEFENFICDLIERKWYYVSKLSSYIILYDWSI